jgi:primosomal protein N' (replication factor Y)
VPAHLNAEAVVGSRVRVRFSGRPVVGYVVARDTPPPEGVTLLNVEATLDSDLPTFGPEVLRLCHFVADYYRAPVGEVLRGAHPPGVNESAEPALKLTAAGREAEAQGAVPGVAGELLSRLVEASGRSHEAVPLSALKPATAAAIQRLAKAELAERTQIVIAQRVSERTERAVQAVAPAPLRPRGPGGRALKCDLIHAWLVGKGVVPVRHIRAEFGAPETHLARLLAEGGVVAHTVPRLDASLPGPPVARDRPPALNAAQRHAVSAVGEAVQQHEFASFLLHGITGSGKTEVYLHAIEAAVGQGLGALVLVPEIALTPQLVSRFRARLGDTIAVLHSGLTDAARYAQWQRLRRGEVQVAIGARSAVFAPVHRLGLVVVDEEHDPSYKQQDGVRYHARDMALVRAAQAGAVALLGSATPSLESVLNVDRGKLRRLVLSERPTGGTLPAVQLIDLRVQRPPDDDAPFLSEPLRAALADTLARGEQSILFLNRRGHSSAVQCEACGQCLTCERCDLPFTWHQRQQRLRCHHCDAVRTQPRACPQCNRGPLSLIGRGTERLEEALAARFPQARLGRMDRDEVTTSRKLEALLDRVRAREIDILVGTQMVTKGHDFPGVTLVGVVAADASLNFPDLRASERTFQLLAQVAGRAGRGDRPGRVLVQTYEPEAPALRTLVQHDHAAFATHELERRQFLRYPPFTHLAALRFDGRDGAAVDALARRVARVLTEAGAGSGGSWISGPAPAALPLLRERTRYSLLLFAEQRGRLRVLLDALDAAEIVLGGDLRMGVDLDPYDFM